MPQQNYSTYERESLAVVAAALHFRVYLLDRPFVFRADHRALTWLFSIEPKGSARVSGWVASLMEFPIVIEYVKGTENTIADIFSRFEGHAVDQIVARDIAIVVAPNVCPIGDADRFELGTDWLNEQRADRTISRVAHLVASGAKPDADEIN